METFSALMSLPGEYPPVVSPTNSDTSFDVSFVVNLVNCWTDSWVVSDLRRSHTYVTSLYWRWYHEDEHIGINSLRPSEDISRHRSGSTLVQVMAFCLQAPRHYLNQCLLITSKVQRHSSRANSQDIPQPSITHFSSKITYLKFHSNELISAQSSLPNNRYDSENRCIAPHVTL